jgi:hypothetical protein
MCMMCEEEGMYQAYLEYLARKAAESGEALTPEEQSFLRTGGFAVSGFACDPAPDEGEADEPGLAPAAMPKAAS